MVLDRVRRRSAVRTLAGRLPASHDGQRESSSGSEASERPPSELLDPDDEVNYWTEQSVARNSTLSADGTGPLERRLHLQATDSLADISESDPMVSRRTFITATGSMVSTLALAGCSSNSVSESNGGGAGDGGGPDTETEPDPSTTTSEQSVDQTFDPVNMAGEEPEDLGAGVTLISHSAYETAEAVGVTGVIENTSEEAFSNVSVTVALEDGDEQVAQYVDTTEAELERLVPGLQWRFWVTFEDETLTDSMRYVVDVSVQRTGEGTATAGNETVAVEGTDQPENETATSTNATD